MEIINKVAELFFEKYHEECSKEDFDNLQIVVNANDFLTAFDKTKIEKFCCSFCERDSYKIKIVLDDEQTAILDSNSRLFDDFLKEIEYLKKIRDTESKIKLYFDIIKNKISAESNKIALYSSSTLIKTLNEKNLNELLFTISNALIGKNEIIVEEFNGFDNEFATDTIMSNSKVHSLKKINRNGLIEKRNNECNFLSASELTVVPDDLNLNENFKNEQLKESFKKLMNIVSLFYIANISELKDEKLAISIEGFKKYTLNISLNDFHNDSNDFYEIYKWIYNEGNLSDKIKLARSVISFNINNDFILKKGTIDSIKSNYNIYLKENIRQYIDVKNKISDFIYDLSQKATKIVEDLSQQLGSNVIGFLTFFITIIVFNSLSANKFDNIFTKDISYISYSLLLLSFFYLILSLVLTRLKVKRLEKQFESMKKRYNDLLDPNDINTIIGEGKDFNDDKKFINNKSIFISIFWFILLIVLGVTITILKK